MVAAQLLGKKKKRKKEKKKKKKNKEKKKGTRGYIIVTYRRAEPHNPPLFPQHTNTPTSNNHT